MELTVFILAIYSFLVTEIQAKKRGSSLKKLSKIPFKWIVIIAIVAAIGYGCYYFYKKRLQLFLAVHGQQQQQQEEG